MNELDPDLQFTFEELNKNINFLDMNLKIINNKLHFNVYHNSTNSFSYLPIKLATHRTRETILHYH